MTEQSLLELLPFWNKISLKNREKLLKATVIKNFSDKEILHTGLDDCMGVFLIKSGRVRVYTVTKEGKELTLFRLLSRDVCLFSASCMLKNINFNMWIATESPVMAYLIPIHIIKDLAKEEIAISQFINDIMSSRMSDIMWVLEQLLYMSMESRLALFLLEQSALEETSVLSITHEQIANHLGSAREVVSRTLKVLATEGLVDAKRGIIKIIDEKGLSALAYGDKYEKN